MNQMIAVDPERLDRMERQLSELTDLLRSAKIQPERQWMTIPQYAAHIDKSVRTIKRRIADGKLETADQGGECMVRALV